MNLIKSSIYFLVAMLILLVIILCQNNKPPESIRLINSSQFKTLDSLLDKSINEKDDSLILEISKSYYQKENHHAQEQWAKGMKHAAKIIKNRDPQEASKLLSNSLEKIWWETPTSGSEKIKIYLAWLLENRLGQFNEAKFLYEELVSSHDKLLGKAEESVVKFIYKPLGNIYVRNGEYQKAELIFKRAIDSINLKKQIDFLTLAEVYSDLGNMYYSINNDNKTIETYQKGIEVLSNSEINAANFSEYQLLKLNNTKGLLYSNLAQSYQSINQNKAALNSIDSSLFYLKKGNKYLTGVFHTKGGILSSMGEVSEAKKVYNNAINIGIDEYGKNRREISKIELDLAGLENLTEALKLTNSALQRVLPNLKIKDQDFLPSKTDFYQENTILEAVNTKGQIYFEQHQKNGKKETLRKAKAAFEKAIEVDEYLRNSYSFESSKFHNLELSQKQFGSLMEVLYKLYETSNSEEKNGFANAIFETSEKSRSVLLNEGLSKNFIELESNDQMFGELKNLNEEIVKLSFNISESKNKQLAGALKLKLFETNNRREKLNKKISKKYPSFTKYETANISKTQSKPLINNQLLIEYFIHKNFIYITAFSKNKPAKIYKKQLPDNFSETIQNFVTPIRNTEIAETDEGIKKEINEFVPVAQLLYNVLLKEILEDFSAEELLIIPDKYLSYLPFDVLLFEAPGQKEKFKSLPYLIKKYSIGYGFSATSILNDIDNKIQSKFKNNFIGIMPKYSGKNGLTKIRSKSVKNLNKTFNSTNISKPKAADFIKNLEENRVLYFHGHAGFDEVSPQKSWMAFSDEKFLAYQINSLNLKNDLIILNGCHSANGFLAYGEGVQSLGRAFRMAGCSSILMNLWKAPDKYSGKMNENFIHFLKDGKLSKAKALQMAKIEHIKNSRSPQQMAPSNWAMLSLYGNPNPLNIN